MRPRIREGSWPITRFRTELAAALLDKADRLIVIDRKALPVDDRIGAVGDREIISLGNKADLSVYHLLPGR